MGPTHLIRVSASTNRSDGSTIGEPSSSLTLSSKQQVSEFPPPSPFNLTARRTLSLRVVNVL